MAISQALGGLHQRSWSRTEMVQAVAEPDIYILYIQACIHQALPFGFRGPLLSTGAFQTSGVTGGGGGGGVGTAGEAGARAAACPG